MARTLRFMWNLRTFCLGPLEDSRSMDDFATVCSEGCSFTIFRAGNEFISQTYGELPTDDAMDF